MKPEENPFRQSGTQHVLQLDAPQSAIGAIESAFDDVALSASSFENSETPEIWHVEIIIDTAMAATEIKRRMGIAQEICGAILPIPTIIALKEIDWVSNIQQTFPPFEVARYWVHGSHVPERKEGKLSLMIDAGMAFGTGEHPTTRGCLLALDTLAKQRDFTRMLDVGAGTGILAIAMAKTWNKKVIATDIDPIAVEVAAENVRLNHVGALVESQVSNGYEADIIAKNAPYQLITSNILAGPLVELAPDLARHLANDGIAILSGLLAEQEEMVMEAHMAVGMTLKERIAIDGWHTLVIGH